MEAGEISVFRLNIVTVTFYATYLEIDLIHDNDHYHLSNRPSKIPFPDHSVVFVTSAGDYQR